MSVEHRSPSRAAGTVPRIDDDAVLTGIASQLRVIARRCRSEGRIEMTTLAEIDRLADGLDGVASQRQVLAPEVAEARMRHLQRRLVLRTPRAAEFLLYLADHPGQLCPYHMLERAVGGGRNVINVYACYVRSALVKQQLEEPLVSEVGQGYRLSVEAAAFVRGLFAPVPLRRA
ncbi:helix-turn-helix domain-containing protein [Novosphingobium sp. JCM 18896]|uniref:helix-turn-helix domain-containing protein n=1 Tax=Novosphingobium sp. JCM 18896 TaxID=2989731 RepID=UPI002223805E|nr:helix-turn-helix domain-containing protein [Novosphingobium sp. JCM 18896]MCW1430821.1 helix-turn-helix domain-containing protein [Novosphingobium sp. JCM 18896]